MSRLRITIGAAALVLAAVIVAAFALTGRNEPRPAAPVAAAPSEVSQKADPSHTKPVAMRTVIVYSVREPAASEPGPIMRAQRLSGVVPTRPTTATVLTDEDCAADSTGLSRCRNALLLANGRRLTVRHPHRMAQVACMTPGERVRVKPA